jgi:hypothetical protein
VGWGGIYDALAAEKDFCCGHWVGASGSIILSEKPYVFVFHMALKPAALPLTFESMFWALTEFHA